MDEFPKLKAVGVPKKTIAPIDVSLLSNSDRTALRMGVYYNENIIEFEPVLSEKESISIIITAYQTQNFIEECLNSIENQTYFINNDNYEVLLGIDACRDVLNKVLEIRYKYRNLRVFMMGKNKGTYVTTNTLLKLVKYDNILRFDSDDIMIPQMINEIMVFSKKYDVIRMKCRDFIGEKDNRVKKYVRFAAGTVFYKRNVINMVGGYQPWICAADSEILERIKKCSEIGFLDKVLFSRRVHNNSLSQKEETKLNSKIRNSYHKKINEIKRSNVVYIKKISGRYFEI